MSDVSIEYECGGKSGELSGDMLLGIAIEYDGEGGSSSDIIAGRTSGLRLADAAGLAARACVRAMANDFDIAPSLAAALVTLSVIDKLNGFMEDSAVRKSIADLARSMGMEVPDGESQ